MKRNWPISQVLISGSIAVAVAAVIATIVMTNTTLRTVDENLPGTLMKELDSLDKVLDSLSNLRAAAEVAAANPSVPNIGRLEKRVQAAADQIDALRRTYVFDNLVQASDFHAVVAPAISDLQIWLAEGVSGYGPRSRVTARIILTRISEASDKAAALGRRSRLMAQEIIDAERTRLEDFLAGVNLLFLLTLLISGIMIFLFARQHLSRIREIRAQEALKTQSDLLNSLFEKIMLGITVWGRNGALLFANRSFAHITGYDPAEITGLRSWFEKVYPDPDYRKMVVTDWREASKQPDTVREYTIISKGGREKEIEFRGAFLPDGRALVTLTDITRQKQAEKALQDSEQKYRAVVENTPDLLYRTDVRGRITFISSSVYDLSGYTVEEAMGMKMAEEVYAFPEERQVFLEKLAKTGRVKNFEARLKGKDGTIWWASTNAHLLRDDQGNVLGVEGVTRDITENKAFEARLRESQERFRVAGKASYDLIYEWDVHTDALTWFGDVDAFLGFEKGNISDNIGAWLALIHPEDQPLLADAVERHRTSIDPIRYEYRIMQKDGTWQYWSDNGLPLLDEAGKPFKWVGVCTDITTRRRQEAALQESEQRMRAILEATPDPIVLYDTQGHPKYINPAFTEVFGWTFDELQGGRIPFVPEDQQRLTGEKIREIYTHGRPLRFETRRFTREGDTLDIFLSAAVTKDPGGTPTGMVAHLTDITQRKALEAQYEHAQKMESLGTLAGGIAHDFNNLLGGIYGYLDLARKKNEDPKIGAYLTKAYNSSERARSLTQQLLTFSKGGAPVKTVEPLVPFLEDATRFALSGANVSAVFDLPRDLWMCDYDRNQMGQVVDNIVINAHHAMPDGGTIHVAAANETARENRRPGLKPGKYVHISISDTGTGIPEKYLSRIFDPFFTTKHAGSGLGLATSYSIVKRHGGIIEAESEPGKGSTFHIYVPAAEHPAYREKKVRETQYRGSGNILIMDDEDMMLDMLSSMLQSLGFTAFRARDGQGAMDAFRRAEAGGEPFRAVILDLTVPGGMGGKDTLKQIRKLDTHIPVFVASGYSEDDAIANPEKFGFTASLGKPFSLTSLSRLLEAHLEESDEHLE